MTLTVGINGLGRIGRCLVRLLAERDDIKLVAANGPAAIETHTHLLEFDSIHGRLADVSIDGNTLNAGKQRFKVTHERDPGAIDWAGMGVDIVLECSGRFNNKAAASAHFKGGAKKVLISAPASEVDATIVYGVNHDILTDQHNVISVGSCTTNCLAPLAKTLHDAVGIEAGFMTTIHSYTGDQNLVDGSHKDLRRARAAALSMIPTSTGAAKALGLVLPQLAGKIGGTAIRVPTPNVSLVDLTFTAGRDISADEINQLLKTAEAGAMKGVLATSNAPLVSIDFTRHPASSIADLTATSVTGKRFVRVCSWYDNEWGFSGRMLDVAKLLAV